MNPLRRLIIPGLTLVALILIGVIGFSYIEGWPLIDSLYMMVITLSTVGFREVRPLNDIGKIFIMGVIVCGVGIGAYTISQVIEIIVEGEIIGYRRRKKMDKKISELRGHYIICGYGRVGHQVAQEFDVFKVPYVVIDGKPETEKELEGKHMPYIIGNVTLDENLEKAGIKYAKGLIAAADSDTDNVFVTISARVLNPNIYIVARAGRADLEEKLRRAGADRIISPYFIAGKRMAALAIRPVATDFLDMVMHGEHFELEMREIIIDKTNVIANKTLGEAQVRQKSGAHIAAIKKLNGSFNLQPTADSKIEAGDILVTLGTPKQLDTLESIIIK